MRLGKDSEGDKMIRPLYLIRDFVNKRLSQSVDIEELKEKYKEGLAEKLGVSPEDISDTVAENWAKGWLKKMAPGAVEHKKVVAFEMRQRYRRGV